MRFYWADGDPKMLHFQIPPNATRPDTISLSPLGQMSRGEHLTCSSDLVSGKTLLFRICQTLSFRRG